MDGLLVTRKRLKWAACTVAALFTVMVVLAAAAVLYASHSRGLLIRYLAACTGRQIRIEGRFSAHLFSLNPRLVAQRVTVGNPPWTPAGTTAEIERVSLVLALPLFHRPFVIRRLEIEGARLHLVRDAAGRANWQWADPGQRAGEGPPLIRSLWVPNAHVDLEDARRHLKFAGTASAHDVSEAPGPVPLRIEAAGQLNGRAATLAINADPLATVERERPYRFAFAERSSGSRLDGRGFLPRPFDFRALDTTFEAAGEDMKDLYFLTGVALPNTGAYRLSGTLKRQGTNFNFSRLRAVSGKSDMYGDLSIETSSGRPQLNGDLHSRLLRSADIGARAAGRATEEAKDLLLPDTVLPLKGLRRSDAVVNFHAAGFEMGHVLMHALTARITIDHGILTVAPLSAAFLEGRIAGRLRVDATREVPASDLDLRMADLRLGQLDRKGNGQPPFDGLLRGRLTLTGQGRSVHQFASTASGTATAVLPRGTIRASLAELTGIDLTRGLGLLLTKNKEETGVRCGIASFQAHDGTLTAQGLVIDTDPVLITGKGQIHLDSEALDLELRGNPKKWRLLRLRSPVSIGGTLRHPSIGIDAGRSIAQAGAAVALGVVLTPLAAVLAFVDPGLAKDADCSALLAQGNAQ